MTSPSEHTKYEVTSLAIGGLAAGVKFIGDDGRNGPYLYIWNKNLVICGLVGGEISTGLTYKEEDELNKLIYEKDNYPELGCDEFMKML